MYLTETKFLAENLDYDLKEILFFMTFSIVIFFVLKDRFSIFTYDIDGGRCKNLGVPIVMWWAKSAFPCLSSFRHSFMIYTRWR